MNALNMRWRSVIFTVAASLAVSTQVVYAKTPNIVLIVADDLGSVRPR